jgi:hypothetical protein
MRRMPGDGTFRATDKQPARRLGGATGRGFMPGRSGNPAGRAKGLETLAREHTAEAIAALVAALRNPRERVPAAIALLDRGWGRPKQTFEADTSTSAILLHLDAAQAVSPQLVVALGEQRTINGHAEPAEPVDADLLMSHTPLE